MSASCKRTGLPALCLSVYHILDFCSARWKALDYGALSNCKGALVCISLALVYQSCSFQVFEKLQMLKASTKLLAKLRDTCMLISNLSNLHRSKDCSMLREQRLPTVFGS